MQGGKIRLDQIMHKELKKEVVLFLTFINIKFMRFGLTVYIH